MTGHLADDTLVALALDDLDDGARTAALDHLRACGSCRAGYDEVRLGVEAALPAAPSLEPSPGFDERVLAAMGMSPTAALAPALERRRSWRLLPAAAALAVGLALGAGITWWALGPDDEVATTIGTSLTDARGAVVGSVSDGIASGEPVLVVSISEAPEDGSYTCVVTLTDGSTVDVGTWDGEGTWVVTEVDPDQAARIEMVRDDGTVWSSADLS